MFTFSLPLRGTLVLVLSGCLQLAAAQAPKPSHAAAGKAVSANLKAQSAKKQPVEPASLAPLSAEQLEIANRVALGKMPCELGAHVSVRPDVRGAGRFVLELGSQKFSMVAVSTRTGAIRLEDEAAGVVWLQLANKSMLMSQKQGKRLADACVSSEQLVVAKELERNPAPSLLEAPVILQASSQAPAVTSPKMAVAEQAAVQ